MAKKKKDEKKTRRANGEGSIIELKNGTYRADITLPNGKRKSYYGKSRKIVFDKIQEALAQAQKGQFVDTNKLTVGEWVTHWLKEYSAKKTKQSTWESYDYKTNKHIIPDLGDIKLQKLQTSTVQKFYNSKIDAGLSTSHVRHMHVILKQALDQAVRENLIIKNVVNDTEPPTVKNKRETIFFTEDQLETLITAARSHRLAAAFILDISTGLRRGELLGLCWDAVDLNRGTITIKRQLLGLKDGPVLDEDVKTSKSKRTIPIPANIIKELKAHKTRQKREKLLYGPDYQDNKLLFCQPDGAMIEPKNFTRWFQTILRQVGLPKARLHDIRHSHASLLLKRGINPKVIQERLGHSTIGITLDLYSHLTPGMQEEASNMINDLFADKRTPPKTGEAE